MSTPVTAIRAFCNECVGGSPFEIKECGGDKCSNGGCDKNGVCWFFKYRMGTGRPSVKLIRKYCLFCQGEQPDWVRECHEADCALHDYRMATNPQRSGVGGNRALNHDVSRAFAA